MADKWYKHPNFKLLILAGIFLFAFFVPFSHPKINAAIQEAFMMLAEYAKEHVLLCLVPAFFIAGAIMVFLNQQAVIKYLGPKANKFIAYSVASVSGAILAVCSCTVLPIFKGIYKKGAGIGPAVSFLYSGPAINILAIVLTAKVLGAELGLAHDFSPVAVAVILNREEDKIPSEIQDMVRVGVESGAALSGTVQTPNIGFEKIICNIIANPNIRYLILAGPESEGHMTGDALKSLFANGIDDKKYIIGTEAKYPLLYNIPMSYILHFLEQINLIDLQFKASPELIKKAVWSCYQEKPVQFENYTLYDKGAFEKGALSGKITDRIMEPWKLPQSKSEQEAIKRMQELVKKLKEKKEGK